MNCPKCYTPKKQTRVVSTDHGDYMTRRFYRCLKCNHHWRSSEVLDNAGVHWNPPPKRKHGGFNTGEKHPNAILFDCNVIEIRTQWAKGKAQRELSKLYGVSEGCIHDIVKRKTWKHIA